VPINRHGPGVPCAACFERLKFAEKELKSNKDIAGITGKYEGNFHIKHMVDFVWTTWAKSNKRESKEAALRTEPGLLLRLFDYETAKNHGRQESRKSYEHG